MTAAPAKSLAKILDFIRAGGRVCVPTMTRVTVIDRKALAAWERAGMDLLKEEGEGYRMRVGKGSVYVLPGQLKIIND